jgi:hypothetical protein
MNSSSNANRAASLAEGKLTAGETGEPSAPWKCAGCGAETTDLIRNCACPTSVLFRRVDGKTCQALKFEHAAHSRWPRLTPLEALLADALGAILPDAELGNFLKERRSYSYGDRYTQPEEHGINWEWQQRTPDDSWAVELQSDIECHLKDAAETEAECADLIPDWKRNPVLAARAILAPLADAERSEVTATGAELGPGNIHEPIQSGEGVGGE